ncbi:MAG: histidinol dehydrogenase [Kiritimatiellia bacterium]
MESFLQRAAFDPEVERRVACILSDVRNEGNRAVLRYIREFDGARLTEAQLAVGRDEIETARRAVDRDTWRALNEARKRVTAFARQGMRRTWKIPTACRGWLGERFMPFDRVGVYIPGGRAPLVSTVIMTVTLAKVAGVAEIVACTPCDRKGRISPPLLAALDQCGATEIYRVGGAQAIGMLAYGTETVRKVRKIVGPGGPFVTAAKRQIYGHVAVDLVAGPSEIAVLADETADPRYVAADLLSQLEHGTGWEKALLVTCSSELAKKAQKEFVKQTRTLSHSVTIARSVAQGNVLFVVVNSPAEGIELCNSFAPEHLELMLSNATRHLRAVRCAGAVFVGEWTPEAAGDYAAGPSHVLPTGGAAAMFSGLSVDDFRRRSSTIFYTRRDLAQALPIIRAFGRVEGLTAHVRSALYRFEKERE